MFVAITTGSSYVVTLTIKSGETFVIATPATTGIDSEDSILTIRSGPMVVVNVV